MPKLVDHEQRRAELTDAVWRVIGRAGVEHASVRAVAAESGWSMGAVRHYFASQDELLAFALDRVIVRAVERADAVPRRGTPRAVVAAILEQAVPLDADRATENAIWFGFAARARVDPALGRQWLDAVRRVRHQLGGLLSGLADGGLLQAGLDVPTETLRLHALLDGMAVQALHGDDGISPAEMRRVIRAHLAEILDPSADGPLPADVAEPERLPS